MKLKDVLHNVLAVVEISTVFTNSDGQTIIRTGNREYYQKHDEWNELFVVSLIPMGVYKFTIYLSEVSA